jgi:RNA polymerase sigma factor (sigma-70 family)
LDAAAPARRPHLGALSQSSLRHEGDDRLVALTRGGSERAFAEIMRRYQRPLHFYCRQFVGMARAEDAVQQTFMQAFVALRDGERREIALRPWLYRIAHNCSIDLLRKHFDHDELDPEHDGMPQPAGVFEQKEELARVVRAIQELPEGQRRALTLRELEGRSYCEISKALGHTDSGVRQLIFRARTALRNLAGFAFPVGSLRWRLLGSPGPAAADPHQVVATASASDGGAGVFGAASAAVAATITLLGGGTLATGGPSHSHAPAAALHATAPPRPPAYAGAMPATAARGGRADALHHAVREGPRSAPPVPAAATAAAPVAPLAEDAPAPATPDVSSAASAAGAQVPAAAPDLVAAGAQNGRPSGEPDGQQGGATGAQGPASGPTGATGPQGVPVTLPPAGGGAPQAPAAPVGVTKPAKTPARPATPSKPSKPAKPAKPFRPATASTGATKTTTAPAS